MNQYVEVLNAYLAENPPPSGNCEMKTLLGKLYCCYSQNRGNDSEQITAQFRKLDSILSKLSLKEQDRVADLACELSAIHQREAFEEGLLTGFRLFKELTQYRS